MDAFTVVEPFFCEALEIGDGRIAQANDAAAELYGYACAPELVGRFLSDLHTRASRTASAARWAARNEGYVLSEDYCTVVRRPDGEIVGHRGTLVARMSGVHGGSYLARLELVREVDAPRVPDLRRMGITPAQAEAHTGRYTVADVRLFVENQGINPLQNGERFTTIVNECERLSILNGWAPGQGLDYALRNDLVTWSLSEHASKKTLVYSRYTHPECGRSWDGQTPTRGQCPSCRAHLERVA